MNEYVYVSPLLDAIGRLADPGVGTAERQKIVIHRPPMTPVHDVRSVLDERDTRGVVFELSGGSPRRQHLRLFVHALGRQHLVWIYWPAEQALERVDDERLRSLRKLWLVGRSYEAAWRTYRRLRGRPAPSAGESIVERAEWLLDEARRVRTDPAPAPVGALRNRAPSVVGAYLRTDFWARLTSGGSYGHTCYVAERLASRCSRFAAFMAAPYPLLDGLGVKQIVLQPPSESQSDRELLGATTHYRLQIRAALEAFAPDFLYERLCLGNLAGALVARELGIPYVVEYNGSELSMRRSFEGTPYAYEDVYSAVEFAAFSQAALITVVSDAVAADLIQRGVDPSRIVVNPNGADAVAYAPADQATRRAIRAEFGWDDSHRIGGFIGTYGGWHGIDVLAEALAPVCAAVPAARFLLIGDGPNRSIVDRAIAAGGLGERVRGVGRVPQEKAARLLKACDVFLSPHNSHMVDSRFFGSPTKLFEYMALGGGIVASDLEQLGDVLSPALHPSAFEKAPPLVRDERAVLCEPGNLNQFIAGTVGLLRYPEVASALGRNARLAILQEFTWDRHVQRIWECLTGIASPQAASYRSSRTAVPAGAPGAHHELAKVETGDRYKDEVQNQWNNNPVGSQYVKKAAPHTLDWFLEVEAHRYGEYAPWMPRMMEFAGHGGERVLEIGGGMGTDLAQFASHGATVTDVDLSAGHLELARENFRLRGLRGTFVHHDAETLPFGGGEFDLVYSNGVIHHSPNTEQIVREIYRVLRPGGRAIVMVYAESSLHYWRTIVGRLGLLEGMICRWSVGEIMSRYVELTANDARPLVKVYTRRRLRRMFAQFRDIHILQRQLTRPELPTGFGWVPVGIAGRLAGWNLVIKARKPERA